MSRQLAIVSTPYQLLNILALVGDGILVPKETDLIVVPVFSRAHKITDNLKNEQLFANVNILPQVKRGEQYPSYWTDLLERKHYDEIFCSFPHRFLAETFSHLRVASPSKAIPEVILFDDGLGSYISDIFHSGAQALQDIPVRKIYLSSPDMMLPSIRALYAEINPFEIQFSASEAVQTVERIFDMSLTSIAPISGIYLSQPFDLKDMNTEIENEILRILPQHDPNMLWRAHPRDTKCCPIGFAEAYSFVPWEILCASDAVSDKSVLIGIFSTAQFSPVLTAGKFPQAIFLFDLVFPPNHAQLCQYRQLAYHLDHIYEGNGHMHKVHVPKSIEELRKILSNLSF